MRHNINGFIDGYQQKQAGTGFDAAVALGGTAAGYKLTTDVMQTLLPWLLLAPILVGTGAGALHAKLMSPSKLDASSAQKALKLAEIEEFATDLTRRREASKREQKNTTQLQEDPGERTLHV